MKKYLYSSLVALSCFFLISFNFQTDKPTLYIIGDSTVRNGSGKGTDSLFGWGSVIAPHFDTNRLDIQNHAIGGRSSRTFLTDGRWEKILTNLHEGDFVIMQFGHNDAGALDDTSRARGTIRGISDSSKEIYNPIRKVKETVYTYGWYMRKYVTEAKAKGAIPIICSLVPRNDWDKDGKVKLSSDSYALWAQQIAEQEGAFFIDLNKKVALAYEEIGKEAVLKQFFPKDHTHTDYDGARLNAEIVANNIRSLSRCPLVGYLNPIYDVFDKNYITKTMIKVTDWQLKHPLHSPTDWTNGAFYTGVMAAFETTKSQAILDSLMSIGERNHWQTHKRYDHADDIAVSQTYVDLYRLKNDKRMIQSTLDSVSKLMTTKGNEATKHGITWWWCDALFMAPPTLAKLSKTLKTPQYLSQNDVFYQECYDLLYDKNEHLFYRDDNYNLNDKGEPKRKEGNGQKVFWSRGNGWVAAGLVRLLNELPADYPKRPFYEQLFKEMMAKVQTLQQADGMWRASLLDPMAYPGGEGSGSGFYCYAMAWGVNNGLLDKAKYTLSVKKAWQGINSLLSPEGRYGWVQPIGADPRRNFSAESFEVFGAGAYLLAGSEVIKLK